MKTKQGQRYSEEFSFIQKQLDAFIPLELNDITSSFDYQDEFNLYALNILSYRYIINAENLNVNSICIISESVTGNRPKDYGSYCTYKMAINTLIKQYCVKYGSRVNRFKGNSPGMIDNTYSSAIIRLIIKCFEDLNRSKRLRSSEDVAIKLLAGSIDHINGQDIILNGVLN